MRSTFKLLFYINRQKLKKNGKCPVMGRITLDGKVSQYSTGLEVEPAYWEADTGRASTDWRKESLDCEKKKELVRLNDALSALEAKAHAAYKENVDRYGFVSAEIIKNAVTGKSQVKETLLALMDEHNEEYAKRVGIDRTRHSYVRYLTTRKHIHNFMKYKYNMEDMPLCSLTMRFMTDFTFYLSTVLRLKVSAYNDYLILLHKMTRLALSHADTSLSVRNCSLLGEALWLASILSMPSSRASSCPMKPTSSSRSARIKSFINYSGFSGCTLCCLIRCYSHDRLHPYACPPRAGRCAARLPACRKSCALSASKPAYRCRGASARCVD